MSVVNKMLQDLESRQNQPQQLSADYHPPKKSLLPTLILILVLIVLFSAGGYWWFSEQQKAPEVHNNQNMVPSSPSNETVKKVTADARVEPLQVESVKAEKPTAEPLKVEPLKVAELKIDESEELLHNQSVSAEATMQANQQSDQEPIKVSSFEVSTSRKSADTTESLKQQIHVAMQLNDESKTMSLLNKLMIKDPTNQIARKKLAAMLFAQGKVNESKQIMLDGIALYPDTTELRMMLARLYVQQNNKVEALNTLSELNVSASLEPNYVSFRASLAKTLERYEQAKSDYNNLLLSQPSNAKWWLGLAVSEEKLGNQASALLAYRKVNELNQLSAEVTTFVQQRIQYLAGVL